MLEKNNARNMGWAHRRRGSLYDKAAGRFPHHLKLVTRVEMYHAESNLSPGLWLDVGAGTGRLTKPLSRAPGRQIVALDPSLDMLTAGFSQKRGGNGAAAVLVVTGASDNALPFRDGVFDGAYCFGVLNRFEDWERIVAPVHRVLKPGASFVFNNRCLDAIRANGDHQPARYGFIERDGLDAKLATLGLVLRSAKPCGLLAPGFLIGHWSPGMVGERYEVANFSVRVWLETVIADLNNIDDWVQLEAALSEVLPLEAGMQSVIIASAPVDCEQPPVSSCLPAGTAPRPDQSADRLRAILRQSDVASRVETDPCLDLLSLLAPVLDRATGVNDFLATALPQHQNRIAKTKRTIRTLLSPSLITKMWHRASKAETAVVTLANIVLAKLEGLRDG